MRSTTAIVISLPGSPRTKAAIEEVGKTGMQVLVSDGVKVDPETLLWKDIRGMEAYNDIHKFRSDYIPAALGCRLAGVKAIAHGLRVVQPEDDGFMVFEDDALVVDPVGIASLMLHAPREADCLWFDTNQAWDWSDTVHADGVGKGRIKRLFAARLCTGFWISRDYAQRMLPSLQETDCEWDVFMQREMRSHRFYAYEGRQICRQKPGVSEITGDYKWAST